MNKHSDFRTTTLKPVNYANMKKQLRALDCHLPGGATVCQAILEIKQHLHL